MEQGGLAGTGLAGDQHVLAGALADGEHLEFLGAGAADRHAQFLAGVGLSSTSSGGGAICENGTSTRLESMLARPMRWTSVIES